ncbi:sporulation protein YabP [Cellulosilyticum sp. I15G10I2]|uniref:sporulation protein YabP n=1 Tax=Cellulosilyticum sp. I15G10I2 TaxID=1892843 RepID=UPI00085CBA54|nr:sporulation protein YabP [Cellulosilyticum sp. I15G10I2]
MEEKMTRKHVVNIVDRERLSITGVTDVFSFDEGIIELETNEGYIEIKGEDLHIVKMNIDDGDMIVEGTVTELIYHDHQGTVKKKGSIISKLFK